MMSEKIKEVYTQHTWIKLVALFGLVCVGIVLIISTGGFPPWSWRFLIQVLPQIPPLWRVQGMALLFPLLGLCLQSLSLLILWSIVIVLAFRIIRHLWLDYMYGYPARQSFQKDLLAAEQLTVQDYDEDDELFTEPEMQYEVQTTVIPQRPQPVQSRASRPQQQSSTQQSSIQATTAQQSTRGRRYAAQRAVGADVSFPGLSYPTPIVPQSRSTDREQTTVVPVTSLEDMSSNDTPSRASTRNKLRIVPPVPDEFEEIDVVDEEEENEDTTISQEFARLIAKEEQKETQEGSDEDESRLIVSIGLDPGIVRKDAPNEDSLFAIQGMRVTEEGSKPAGLFAVADGMGGHANGREASRTAIHTLSDVIVPTLLRDVSGSSAKEEETLFMDMIKDGVHRANLALYRHNRGMPSMMGTTITAALVINTTAYIVNVGDSRTYLYRAGEGLSQISRDHSVVARLVELGEITREQIYTHPKRNQIYRCLGEHASVEIDTFVVPLQANDVLILCSDGLWEMVQDPELEQIVSSVAYSPSQVSAMLVQAALNHGGADNISVVVVRLASSEQNTNWML